MLLKHGVLFQANEGGEIRPSRMEHRIRGRRLGFGATREQVQVASCKPGALPQCTVGDPDLGIGPCSEAVPYSLLSVSTEQVPQTHKPRPMSPGASS
jgi:hypothetical protein